MKKIIGILIALLPLLAFSQETFVNTSTAKKNVLFEELTGASCGYCPRAHAEEAEFIATYGERFCAVNIHAGNFASPYHEDDPRLNVDEGDQLDKIFSVSGYPNAVIARHKFGNGKKWEADEGKWPDYINEITNEDALVNIAAKANIDWATRKLTVKTQIYYTGNPAESEHYLHVAMTQDRIITAQADYGGFNPAQTLSDGNYLHLHVFRGYVNQNSLDGEAITVETGKVIEHTIEYTLPKEIKDVPLDIFNVHFVAFITADTFAEVQNACNVEVEVVNTPEDLQVIWVNGVNITAAFGCDPMANIEFKVDNMLGAEIETLTYKVSGGVSDQTFTKTFSPALKVGESGSIQVENLALKASNIKQNLAIEVTNINEGVSLHDAGTSAKATVLHEKISVPSDLILLNICQDQNGEEITWKVEEINGNQTGETLYQGGPYPHLEERGIEYNYTEVRVGKGCYLFTIKDDGGNGINSGRYGKGFVSMKTWQDEEFFHHNGKYGDGFSIVLDAREAGIERNSAAAAFKLYPNPTSGKAFIETELPSYEVSIYTLTGVRVRSPKAFTGKKAEINLSGLTQGIYLIEVRAEGKVAYQKMIVK